MRLVEVTREPEVRAIAAALPGTLRHLATGEGFGLLGVDAAGEGAALGLASMYALPMENRTALVFRSQTSFASTPDHYMV
jgi:hypothetical protein